MSVSVLILTLNEEKNLPGCLESVAWCDDIVVFDSYSTDDTEQIAREAGARFIQREFDNWSAHQNWAVQNIQFRNQWVFYIDADERCDEALAQELRSLPQFAEGEGAFNVRRKDMFLGRWLKRAQLYPTWLTRVFRPKSICYERLVNPIAHVHGEVGYLQGHLVHYPFSHGMEHWLGRHNRYSTKEARECLQELSLGAVDWRGLVSTDPVRRRRALKELSFRLPGRPWLKFIYLYLLRGGFLEGAPGLTYCTLQAIYEYMICLKVEELKAAREDATHIKSRPTPGSK